MLISSHRHRSEDLELWKDLEEADLVHGQSDRLKRLTEQSLDVIREFASGGACYGSVSWGKDSVVLAHMLWRVDPSIFLLRVQQVPSGNPHCVDVRDAFLNCFDSHYVETLADYRGCGKTQEELEGRADRIFYGAFERIGISRYFSGIRSDESATRRLRFRHWGHSSKNTCAPLSLWTVADVMGYLAVHNLPVHPNYAMLGNGRWDRNKLRTDEIGGIRGSQFGRREWEQEYYGDVLRRIEAS